MARAKPPYRHVVEALDLLNVLAPFDPVVIGTPPLGIDLPDSDIDIACSAPDLEAFAAFVGERFGARQDFLVQPVDGLEEPAVRAAFRSCGWEVELFCQTRPTAAQHGVRHFEVERRLLALAPDLAPAVRRGKAGGLKTEPAFAAVLGLAGDPYRALLELADRSDDELAALARRALDRRGRSGENPRPEP